MSPPMPRERGFRLNDLTEALNAIHIMYGERSHALPEAMWKAAALWGVTPETRGINDCGVFTYANDEVTLRCGGCKARFTLVQAPNGNWAMSTGYDTRISGGTYAPSVWCRRAFPTRDDARLAALCELIHRFRQEAEDRNSVNGESNRRDIRQMIARLETEKTPQLALF
jgi:hypothetical protein